jgi:hypothetical protein
MTVRQRFEEFTDDWVINFMGKKTKQVDEPVKKTRFRICPECPELNVWNMSNSCGCFMAVKARLPATTCPKNKW